jgi:hypothetical protein
MLVLDIYVRKNSGSHIDASHSRQPLVKGERLVRYEVNAVMHKGADASELRLAHAASRRQETFDTFRRAWLPQEIIMWASGAPLLKAVGR